MSIIYEPAGRAREYAALAANLYTGCSHGCKYCYAPSVVRRESKEFHANAKPRVRVLQELRKDCQRLKDKGAGSVLLSFTTDPYQPCEEIHRLTRQAIGILHDSGLSVEILTKGGMRAANDFCLLSSKDAFATTLTFLDHKQSAEWEPGAALPADRIKAMKLAHEMGIRVWASLEPVIDPAESLELIRQTHKFVDLYKVGRLNYHPLAKTIDWYSFGWDVKKLLEKLGCNYYLKHDLRQAMKKTS